MGSVLYKHRIFFFSNFSYGHPFQVGFFYLEESHFCNYLKMRFIVTHSFAFSKGCTQQCTASAIVEILNRLGRFCYLMQKDSFCGMSAFTVAKCTLSCSIWILFEDLEFWNFAHEKRAFQLQFLSLMMQKTCYIAVEK